jgi:hypothetical protein
MWTLLIYTYLINQAACDFTVSTSFLYDTCDDGIELEFYGISPDANSDPNSVFWEYILLDDISNYPFSIQKVTPWWMSDDTLAIQDPRKPYLLALTDPENTFDYVTDTDMVMVEQDCCTNPCETSDNLTMSCVTDFPGKIVYVSLVSRDSILDVHVEATQNQMCITTTPYVEPDLEPFDWSVFDENPPDLEELKRNGRENMNKRRAMQAMTVTYVDNVLHTIPDLDQPYEVTVTSDIVINYSCDSACSETLPTNWTKDFFFVFIYDGPLLVYRGEFAYVSPQNCNVAHCFFCTENFKTFHCLSWANKIAIIVGSVFGGLLLVITMALLFVSIRTYTLLPTSLAVLLVLCVPLVAACDSNLIISGQNVDCIIDGNTEICSLNTQSLVSLPYLGSTLCLTVMNEDEDLVMGYINITFTESLAVAGLQLDYWTSNRQIQTSSHKSCAGGAYCTATINCATKRTPTQMITMGGALGGPSTTYPGESICSDGCGCAGCNCVKCAESCVYGRYGVQAVPSLYKVMNVATSRLVPRITICYGTVDGAISCNTTKFYSGNTILVGDNYTMTYIGSFQTSFNFLGKRLLIMGNKTNAWFTDASLKNVPIAGTVGEIQANNPTPFTNPTATSYRIASNICTGYLSDASWHYNCIPPPLGDVISGTSLPSEVDGIYWSYSADDTLVGVISNPPGISLTLTGTGSLTFRTRRIQVCPLLSFDSVSGIWGSPVGAQAKLIGKSTCLAGKCVLSTLSTQIELDTPYLELDTIDQELIVFFRSNVKSVSFELSCTSLGKSHTVIVEGELDDPNPIEPITPPVVPDDGFNQWFDDLSLGAKIGFGIGVSLGGLLVLFVLCVILWYLPEIIRYFHRKWSDHKHKLVKLTQNNKKTDNIEESSDIELDDDAQEDQMYTRHAIGEKERAAQKNMFSKFVSENKIKSFYDHVGIQPQ